MNAKHYSPRPLWRMPSNGSHTGRMLVEMKLMAAPQEPYSEMVGAWIENYIKQPSTWCFAHSLLKPSDKDGCFTWR